MEKKEKTVDIQRVKLALELSTQIDKYHKKINAMIDNAYEGPLNTVIYIYLMQRVSESWINEHKKLATTKEMKEEIEECMKLIDDAYKANVFKSVKKEV